MGTQNADLNLCRVGDIGGTHIRLGIAKTASQTSPICGSDIHTFVVEDFPSFSDTLVTYRDQINHRPQKAVLAVAGTKQDGAIH